MTVTRRGLKNNGRSIPNKAGGWQNAGEDRMRVKVNGRDDGEREEKYVNPGMQNQRATRPTTGDTRQGISNGASKYEQDGMLWDHELIAIGEFDEEESTDGCLDSFKIGLTCH